MKKDKIYYYVIEHIPASRIAIYLKVTKAYVSQVIKELIKEGYIAEILYHNKSSKPKLYDKTTKPYPTKLSELTTSSQFALQQPRIHLNIVKWSITQPLKIMPTTAISEGIEVNLFKGANDVVFIDIRKIFDVGRVLFRICNNKTLLLFMPGFETDPLNYRHTKQILINKAKDLANWFTKIYACKLGEMCLTIDPEIATTETDPFLKEMSTKYGMIKLVDFSGNVIDWWDASKGVFEFETRQERQAEIRAFMPTIIENLQDRLHLLQNEVSAQSMVIEGYESKFNELKSLLQKALDTIEDIKQDKKEVPMKEDEFKDVV